jgi:arylsulfatase A-like enzyme
MKTAVQSLVLAPTADFMPPLLLDRRPLCLGALLLSGLLLACGAERQPAAAPEGIELRPGETLLDHLADWRVLDYPMTNLPADVAVNSSTQEVSGSLMVTADDWDEGDILPAPFRHSLELAPDTRVFRAIPRVPFRPGDTEPVLRHAGRRLQPWRLPGTSHLWRDQDAELIFWWDTANASLLGVGRWAPGEASLSMGSEGGTPSAGNASPMATSASPSVSVSELSQRLIVGTTSRPGLLVPAPSGLALDFARWDGRRLHVAVGVAERVYKRDDAGRVLQKFWNQLPVEFSVEVVSDGERRRLWSRSVTAEDGFVTGSIDLSELSGGALSLELHTSSGQPTEGSWPYGFWADLAVTGRSADKAEGRPHIVVLDIDTLRADRLGCYGHTRNTTPRLDDWAAANATVYRDVVAASNWTLPSTASMLTGLSVQQHGMLRAPRVLGEATPTLATRLRQAGYQTFGMVEGGYVSASFGFDQGFDVFDQIPYQNPRWHEALSWLEQRDDGRPVFMFLHTYFVHAPWANDPRFDDPVAPYDGPLAGRDITHEHVIKPHEAGRLPLDDADHAYVNAMYDAAVARLDDYLFDFMDRLDDLLPPGERMLVITSDHGEELFQRGSIEHGSSLYSELVSVPMIIQYPGQSFGSVDNSPVSGLDLVPTVLQTVGLDVPLDLPGRSMELSDPDPRVRVSQHADTARSVQFDGWKLIIGDVEGRPGSGTDDSMLQLYDLESDPGETRDISSAVPEWVRRLQGMLEEFQSSHRAVAPRPDEDRIDAQVLKDLKELGYLNDGR